MQYEDRDLSTPALMEAFRKELLWQERFVEFYTIKWDKAGSIHRVNFAHPKTKRVIEFKSKKDSLTRTLCNITRDKNLKLKGWRVIRLSRDPKS